MSDEEQAVMVQVRTVRPEHSGEALQEPASVNPLAETPQHHEQCVECGYAQRQQGDEDGDDGARLECGGQREASQDEPNHLRTAVSQEDPGRTPVERKEAEAGPADDQRDRDDRRCALEDGEHPYTDGDDDRQAARETVQAVHEIDGVGDADQPEDGRDRAHESELDRLAERQEHVIDGVPGGDHDHCRDDLDGQLDAGGATAVVVHEADCEDQRGRRDDRDALPRPAVSDRKDPQGECGDQAGQDATRDGETARAGYRNIMALALVRVVDRPPAPAETVGKRNGGGRHGRRHERHDDEEEGL